MAHHLADGVWICVGPNIGIVPDVCGRCALGGKVAFHRIIDTFHMNAAFAGCTNYRHRCIDWWRGQEKGASLPLTLDPKAEVLSSMSNWWSWIAVTGETAWWPRLF